MLHLPQDLSLHSVYSAPDDSAMIILETTASDHQLRVYHWTTFGQSPQGCALPLPDGIHLRSATSFCLSYIEQRSNAVLHAVLPDQNMIQSLNIQINSKSNAVGFESMDEGDIKAPKSTAHNSFIDCYCDVWTSFPVASAIKRCLHRDTLSSPINIAPPSITFVCSKKARLFSAYFEHMIKDFERVKKKPVERVLHAIVVHARRTGRLDWRSFEATEFKAGAWFVELLCLVPIQIAVVRHDTFIPLKDGFLDSRQEHSILGPTVDQITDSISLGWYEPIFQFYMATKRVKVVSTMGEQCVGKSFALNHMIDSTFPISGLRTTEGIWLSVCPIGDLLIVALDFEGES
ncbi:hypothetical protein FRC03_011217 [Tulasnella sp. 419]|nr:hypothetical protein FRC03_011217 [Tulasnella sp. 419]